MINTAAKERFGGGGERNVFATLTEGRKDLVHSQIERGIAALYATRPPTPGCPYYITGLSDAGSKFLDIMQCWIGMC